MENYLFDKMADDYAKMIRRKFKGPVDIMGVPTRALLANSHQLLQMSEYI